MPRRSIPKLTSTAIIDYAQERCGIPEDHWKIIFVPEAPAQPKAKGKRGKAKGKGGQEQPQSKTGVPPLMAGQSEKGLNVGDHRVLLCLKLIEQMHNKKYCSFITPKGEQDAGTYYFPAGAPFCQVKRASGEITAFMMLRNPAGL